MLDKPAQNKMMLAPPAKKGFHFASDGLHAAKFIEAETIEEATKLYHELKQLLPGSTAAAESQVAASANPTPATPAAPTTPPAPTPAAPTPEPASDPKEDTNG